MKLKQNISSLAAMPISGLLRLLYLKLIGKDTLVTGSCNGCGECCRLINLRAAEGWIQDENLFKKLVERNPDFNRFTIASVDNSGFLLFNCSWLGGDGICKDYKKRLDICRNYPNKSLILRGGKLLPQCGFQITEVIPFKKILASEMKSLKK